MILTATCACGNVTCEITREPIFSAVCYCDDCQTGGHKIEALENASPVLDPDGGTQYITCRDDRFECTSGENLLTGHQIKDKSPTTRYVASCCNTAMYLKFKHGHWVSTYRTRFKGERPPLEFRNQLKFRQSSLPLPDDVPTYQHYPVRLFTALIKSRIAMAFGR